MKPLLKSNKRVKNQKLSYYEAIEYFLSDDFKLNKRNLIKFLKMLYKLDASVTYDKLTIKMKNLPYAEGKFLAEMKNYHIVKSILIDKNVLKEYKNEKYAKASILSTFIHEIHHKKQFDNFRFNKMCDSLEKNEIEKYVFFEQLLTTVNMVFSEENPLPFDELYARADTLDIYVNMIKKGVVKPTIENLMAIIPSSLQAYSMVYGTYNNNVLLENKNDAKLDANHFYYYCRARYDIFYNNLDIIKLPKRKEEEIKNINFTKFFFELQEMCEKFDDNICFIYNQLLANHNIEVKYKEFATNLEYVSSNYIKENLKQKNSLEDEYKIIP